MATTRVFTETYKAWEVGKRRCLHEGSTSSSKTYSILQALVMIAQNIDRPAVIDITSESLPHLKQGAISDFFEILGEPLMESPYWSKTEFTYKRPEWNGWFRFYGADNEGKAHGPRRDILFINEGNHVPWETARHMDTRTNWFTIVDWNPAGEFWAHEFWKELKSTHYVHSTYKDALEIGVITQQFVDENIEIYKDKDPNWYRIYGLGLLGKVEGLVHPFFDQVDELPEGDYFYGLDFGFGSYSLMDLVGGDPTVLVKNVIVGENLYSEELIYSRKPMTNDDIANEMTYLKVRPNEPIFPDPNEPKSAEEIRRKGFNVQETIKGPGSVAFGIRRVNQFYQFWTKGSVNCIKDQRNYKYIKRRDPSSGREFLSDDTTHQWSHGVDARRYGVASYRGGIGVRSLPVSNVTGRARLARKEHQFATPVSNARGY